MKSSQGPTIVVHIGLPKTATSTIQSFLTMHRATLLQRGVLYPKSIANSDGQTELHRALSVAVEPDSVPWLDGLRRHFASQDLFAALREEVDRTQASTVILSAESLSFVRRPEALRRALAPYPARILVYLRRQDAFLASFYNQLIKTRLYAATFEEFWRQHVGHAIDLGDFRMSLSMCDYERWLDLWAAAFGGENILAGVFEDHDLPNGILRDLARKTEIDISGLSPPVEDTNPSLQPSMLSLKRRVNQFLSSEQERVSCQTLFADYIDGTSRAALADGAIATNIVRRQAILARYQEGNAHVAAKYFAGRPRLFDEPNEHDSPLPDFSEADWQQAQHQAAVRIIARLVTDVARMRN